MATLSNWIEAMRLRTLPVSLGGVIAALGMAASEGPVDWLWGGVCIVFAVLAQVASNFANEYFDGRDGIDTAQRQGPVRGVIAPPAMKRATILTLLLACAIGLLTLLRGGWILLPAGIAIALGALAYSAGPYPLSRNRLGEVAVIIFFGIVPVCLTYYLQTLTIPLWVFICSLGIGLMGAMVILVNNYRDIASDSATGKRTVSTAVGPQGSALIYCAMGQFAAMALWIGGGLETWGFLPLLPAAMGFVGGMLLYRGLPAPGATKLLAITAITMLLTAALLLLNQLILQGLGYYPVPA
ncbi:MAG: 1,4-dihydroxy-2-naphthoate octaprenyltransferase [Muribaculaceae bacterium]|nr:1,4-dihydroxy-2-naphthoate octaprenyltransferase [Muribaculaceae bacterium]